MEPTPLELLLMIGLTARLIRLAVVDDIAEPVRIAVVRLAARLGDAPTRWVLALISCPFCIGFWISLAVALTWAHAGHTAGYGVAALAGTLSYLAGHAVATLDARASDDEENRRG